MAFWTIVEVKLDFPKGVAWMLNLYVGYRFLTALRCSSCGNQGSFQNTYHVLGINLSTFHDIIPFHAHHNPMKYVLFLCPFYR